ncbi:hypothetical protein WJX72_007734 [[Myrmecia] bisecta]|uniref:Uncharacterized protein n=1 Tax=[Myrmecia] bisecta TaxID=41462 RepID=A0AAW1P3Z0_9CHLO
MQAEAQAKMVSPPINEETGQKMYTPYGKFPSIVQFHKLGDFLKYRKQQYTMAEIAYTGTAKLHGTHCDVILDQGEVHLNSRNYLVTETFNPNGMLEYIQDNRATLKHFMELVLEGCLAKRP